jgi:transposase
VSGSRAGPAARPAPRTVRAGFPAYGLYVSVGSLTGPVRLEVGRSPSYGWVREPVLERGALPTIASVNPDSRLGRTASPHWQARVMQASPSSSPVFVGIDVAKDRLDVHLRPSGEAFSLPRDANGLAGLAAGLVNLAPELVVLEATGGFEIAVAAGLAGAGLRLAVVNPRQIRAFARALGRLAKSDRLDAEVIALFAERIRPQARALPSVQVRVLTDLVARRRQIIDMITAESNRQR